MKEKVKLDSSKVATILGFVKNGESIFNFNNESFDIFTNKIITKKLCTAYNLPPFNATTEYFAEAGNYEKLILLRHLLSYYIRNDLYKDEAPERFMRFQLCKAYIELLEIECFSSFGQLANVYGSNYIEKVFSHIFLAYRKNPTEVIGKAKELVESCCKYILDEESTTYSKKIKIPQLVDLTLKQVNLKPIYIEEDQKLEENLKEHLQSMISIIGQFEQMATRLASIRGTHGSGHGKSKDFLPLQVRHARLMINTAVAITSFLFDSYKFKKEPVREMSELLGADFELFEKFSK